MALPKGYGVPPFAVQGANKRGDKTGLPPQLVDIVEEAQVGGAGNNEKRNGNGANQHTERGNRVRDQGGMGLSNTAGHPPPVGGPGPL